MSAVILGIGTALPAGSITQAEALDLARAITPEPEAAARRLAVLYRRTAVQRRGSVLFSSSTGERSRQSFYTPATSAGHRGPTTAARLARYSADAPALAHDACAAALADAPAAPTSITHLITASCTGFLAPGLDVGLIRSLALSPRTERTHVGFMGCHAAINALRVAAAIALADPDARVLVCAVELCSLHFQYGSADGQAVANALFADGAAAAVVARAGDAGSAKSASNGPPLPLNAFGSCILPASGDAMTWTIGDHGFEMTLSPRVPDLLRAHLRPWATEWLGESGLTLEDIESWAIHPGGPRILDVAAEVLGLTDDQLAPSRDILAAHGNMSSPTILFILDRLRRASARTPVAAVAFGPGLSVEGLIIG